MPKKKILHIIQSLGNGGWENALLRLLPILTDKFEHHIITLRELGELAPRFEKKRIPVTTIRWSGFLDIHGYRRLLSETRQFEPTAIITYLFHADMIGRLFLQKRVPAPVIPFLGTTYNYPRYWSARFFEKLTRKFTHHYLANSPAVRDYYVKNIGVPEEKITVISTGIDVDFFDNIEPDPKLRESLRLSPDDFVIICIANLHPNKGHRYLLEAFESLFCHSHEGRNPVKLLIVGDGIERRNLERQTNDYQSKNSIFFLGRRTDVPQLLKISDCFVLPTLFEGMSNAIMEAMSAGLTVITTDIPENRALIENEKTGLLVRTRSTEEIVQALRELINNREKSDALRKAAKASVQRYLSIEITSASLREFLNSL